MFWKNLIEHLDFAFEMFTIIGVASLVIGIFLGFFTEDNNLSYLGAALILYSWLLYNMNWKFDNLKDQIEEMKK